MLAKSRNANSFGTGAVLRVLYFLTLGKYRKLFIFNGICKKFNKRKQTFCLQNFHGNELVEVSLSLFSPYIVRWERLGSYNFEKTVKNLSHLKNMRIQPGEALKVFQPVHRFDPYDYLYVVLTSLPERRRLRRKFRI